MIKPRFPRPLIAVCLAVACAVSVAACSETKEAPADTTVAATVNGVEIYEADVTASIQSIRENYNLSDDDIWAQYLAQAGVTPEEIRSQIIDSYITQQLIAQGAESLGITVEDSEIDQVVATTRANFNTDKDWENALARAGMTEEQYRDNIRTSLLDNKIQESFLETTVVPTEDLDAIASLYGPSLAGAKRSSHILFASTDEATAREVLDRINSGELDFAEAAKQYSKDDGSAVDGGDVGWDKLSNFITEYTTALSQLNKGEVSGLVTSVYGIHIIKCTDVFDVDAANGVTFAQLPKDFQDAIESSLKSNAAQSSYQAWLDEQREAAEIVINDIPADAPYNVDLSKYQTADDESSSASAGAEADASSSSSASEGADASSSASAGADANASSSASASGEASSSSSAS